MSDVRTQADQFMRSIDRRIRDIVQQEMRAKTGVLPGGPKHIFSVDLQGRITSADGFVVLAKINTAQTGITSTSYRIDFDGIVYDPATTITTGSSWVCVLPNPGVYLATSEIALNPGGNQVLISHYFNLALYDVTSGATIIDVLDQHYYEETVNNATNSIDRYLTGSLQFYISAPTSVAFFLDKPHATARDVNGGVCGITRVG